MQCSIPPRHILLVGLGNTLLGDDGVGVHVVRRLGHGDARGVCNSEGLTLLDGGTLGFRLLDVVTRSDAVLFIDAAQLGEPAGATRLIEQSALGEHVRRGGRISAHEAGLVDLLTLARLDGWAPANVGLLAIQPQIVDWNDGLSPSLAAALPAACRRAMATARRWRRAA